MAKYAKLKDYSITAISAVFGSIHFGVRLAADAVKEGEAQLVHLVDKNYSASEVREARDKQYADRMEDLRARIEETRKVMDETYERLARKASTEEIVMTTSLIVPSPPTE